MVRRRTWAGCAAAAAFFGPVGCASPGYQFGRFRPPGEEPPPAPAAQRGEPDPVLDGLAAAVDTPARLLPIGPGPVSRGLSPETEAILAAYLQKNDLTDIHLAVNCYDPAGEWRRLRANTRVAAGWRYTAGALSVAVYSMFPGRVFGTNRYNPFTDTLSVNSDRPVALLYEAAVAKDVRGRRLPGTYAAATSVPGVSLVRGVTATNDVLSYARHESDWATERAAYRELYPRVVMSGTTTAAPLVATVGWWAGPALRLGGAVVGRGAGWVAEARREAEVKAPHPAGSPERAGED